MLSVYDVLPIISRIATLDTGCAVLFRTVADTVTSLPAYQSMIVESTISISGRSALTDIVGCAGIVALIAFYNHNCQGLHKQSS